MSIIDLPIWLQAIIIIVLQGAFVFFRTLNVIANSELNRRTLFLTGTIVHLTWLITTAIGVTAIIKGHWILVICSLGSGLLSADLALVFRKYRNQINDKRTFLRFVLLAYTPKFLQGRV